MFIRQFLEWFTLAAVDERIEAVETFCAAYADKHVGLVNHPDTEAALALILDDPSSQVRLAMAHALAGIDFAPRHIMVALANDHSDVSAVVLAHSNLLTEADLVDCLAVGDDRAQIAIAMRRPLVVTVAAAIVEIGCLNAVLTLLKNDQAELQSFSLARVAERFGEDGHVRQILLARQDLPITVRHALVIRLSENLMQFVSAFGWTERAKVERSFAESGQAAAILLSASASDDERQELIEVLRKSGQLTPALLLRSLLCCNVGLLEAALVSLARQPLARVRGILRDGNAAAFLALYRKAKMPKGLETAFRSALLAVHTQRTSGYSQNGPVLNRSVIQSTLLACANIENSESSKVMGLLRRLDSDAAREDARRITADILNMPSSPKIEHETQFTEYVDVVSLEQELLSFAGVHHSRQVGLLEHAEQQIDLMADIQPERLPENEMTSGPEPEMIDMEADSEILTLIQTEIITDANEIQHGLHLVPTPDSLELTSQVEFLSPCRAYPDIIDIQEYPQEQKIAA